MSRLTTSGQPLPGGMLAAVSADMPAITNSQAVRLADVSQLVRPRIALMVLVTVFAAIWLTAQPVGMSGISWLAVAGVLVGTAFVAASSSIANQILERDSDRLMARTASRPVAAGRLSVSRAWLVTVLSLLVGAAVVWGFGGPAAMLAAVATWVLYVAVYTPLKQRTPLNTAVGAVAGGLPVAIGWFAADGPARLAAGDMVGGLAVAALGTVLYLWQFPHFMAIAWLYRRQYAAAGLQMLTVVDPSGLRAAGQALAAALAMVPVSLVLAVPSASTRLFLTAAVASIVYAGASAWFAFRRDDRSARLLLLTSLGVLLVLMSAAVTFGGPAVLGQA
jgi:protoheme IX farnesyltransferase